MAGLSPWEIWVLGLIATVIGSALFALATYRTRALPRPAAGSLAVGWVSCQAEAHGREELRMRYLPRGRGEDAAAAWVVLAGAAMWSAALVAGPLLQPDLDALTAHPEDYAQGPWAIVMQVGYVGAAVAGLGAALLARRRPVAAVLLTLFGIGAFAIGILPPTSSDASGGTLADHLFPYFQLAPLALFPAMVWISWRERRRSLVIVASIAVLLFLPLLGHPPAGGLLNRAGDLAIAAWLAAFALTRS